MENFRPIGVDEMRRRFALAELDSSVFTKKDTASPNGMILTEKEKEELRTKLLSGNCQEVSDAIGKHRHGAYVYQNIILPRKVKDWYLADLDAIPDEFKNLQVVRTGYWRCISNGTYKLTEAANNLIKKESVDPQTKRIKDTISILNNGSSINLEGIILVCKESDESTGPWEILEGHARLVAIYLQLMDKGHLTMNGVRLTSVPVILGEYQQ